MEILGHAARPIAEADDRPDQRDLGPDEDDPGDPEDDHEEVVDLAAEGRDDLIRASRIVGEPPVRREWGIHEDADAEERGQGEQQAPEQAPVTHEIAPFDEL
jgi:hypothetical protein